ncbi:hypothetical protein D3C87_2196880 [compost metagenome]
MRDKIKTLTATPTRKVILDLTLLMSLNLDALGFLPIHIVASRHLPGRSNVPLVAGLFGA